MTHVLDGRYELGPVLGEGGMARVHRGWDRELRRPVAVKVLAAPYDRDQGFVERFRREARSAAGLGHPNIVSVFDTGSHDGTHFIVTELVQGETLADGLGRQGRLDAGEAVAIAAAVARALSAAHARGIIHRDVKPGNVMLLPDGGVKVVDFGIARAAGSESLTRTGRIMGSSAYLSPEQARGDPVDERSDVYALGCVLYEMLTGTVPFRADTPVATMYRHVNEEPEPPSRLASVPPRLEQVVLRCLEKEPRRRFGSAAELEAALLAGAGDTEPLAAVEGEQTRPVPVTSGRPIDRTRRRRWVLAAAGVALLGLLAALAIGATSDPLRPRQEARAASREAARDAEPPEASDTFADAWTNLMAAISAATASGDLDPKVADELAKHATDMLVAYREGDLDKISEELTKVEDAFSKAVDEGAVSASAADEIDQAIFDLVLALEQEGTFATVSPTEDAWSSSDEGGGEHGQQGGGPTPHAEANGHDDD